MRFVTGTTAGGQISTSSDRIKVIEFHARSTNKGSVVVGISDVRADNGRELPPGDSVTYNFTLVDKEGSIAMSEFYTNLTGSDKVDWSVIKD